MFYAYTSVNERHRFAAFETKAQASAWVIEEVGDDYDDKLWIDANGAQVLTIKKDQNR
jgi:hypothetical protein